MTRLGWLTGTMVSGLAVWLAAAPAQAQGAGDSDAPAAEEEAAPANDGDEAAADPEAAGDGAPGDEAGEAAPEAGEADSEEAAAAAEKAAKEIEADSSPVEDPLKTYYFVGLRYRGIFVPRFMIEAFADGGPDVYVNNFGPEFIVRKDSFEFQFSATWADYSMDESPFRAKSDPIEAYEIVESTLDMIYLMADFAWSTEIVPQLSWTYGMGAGIGIVWGDLYRTQAYPDGDLNNPDTVNNPNNYRKCTAPRTPNPTFCGTDNDHYNGFTEPNWLDGGSVPVVFPWLSLQTGLRYKPHRNFVGRIDLGLFSTSGFWFGVGADYGF